MDTFALIPIGILLCLYLVGGHLIALIFIGNQKWLLKHRLLTIIAFEFHAIFWGILVIPYLIIGFLSLIPSVLYEIFLAWNQSLQEEEEEEY